MPEQNLAKHTSTNMAIPFLNNLNIDDNQLQNAKLHVTSSAPTAAAGQIYFDSTVGTETAKYYDGNAWISLIEYTPTNSTFVNLAQTGADATRNLTASLSATGTPSATTFLRGDNVWAAPAGSYTSWNLAGDSGTPQAIADGNTATFVGSAPISTVASSTDTLTISHDDSGVAANTYAYPSSVQVNATGHVVAISAGSAPGTMSSFTLTGDSGSNQTILDGNTLDVAGGTNISTVVGATDTVTVNLDDSITLAGTLTVSGAGQSSFTGQVTIPSTPSASTDAASKNYVDTQLAGSGVLIFQGGYNAATNTPDLDVSPSASIKKGWSYVVTADGSFFTEQVRVGDFLIANDDSPTALSDWTTVQSNIDLATLSTVGIGNVNAGTAIGVSYSSGTATVTNTGVTSIAAGEGIDVSGSTGAVTVSGEDSSATNKGVVIVAGGSGISVSYASGTATVTNTESNSDYTFAGTLAASGTITHNLGSRDVIVQLYDTVTYETVHAVVDRDTTNTVIVTFASIPSNSIRVLVQKIG